MTFTGNIRCINQQTTRTCNSVYVDWMARPSTASKRSCAQNPRSSDAGPSRSYILGGKHVGFPILAVRRAQLAHHDVVAGVAVRDRAEIDFLVRQHDGDAVPDIDQDLLPRVGGDSGPRPLL